MKSGSGSEADDRSLTLLQSSCCWRDQHQPLPPHQVPSFTNDNDDPVSSDHFRRPLLPKPPPANLDTHPSRSTQQRPVGGDGHPKGRSRFIHSDHQGQQHGQRHSSPDNGRQRLPHLESIDQFCECPAYHAQLVHVPGDAFRPRPVNDGRGGSVRLPGNGQRPDASVSQRVRGHADRRARVAHHAPAQGAQEGSSPLSFADEPD